MCTESDGNDAMVLEVCERPDGNIFTNSTG